MACQEQIGAKATLINLVCIEKSKEDEVVEHHLMEAYIVQKDAKEDNVVV
jgi:hypothetical protein